MKKLQKLSEVKVTRLEAADLKKISGGIVYPNTGFARVITDTYHDNGGLVLGGPWNSF